MNSKKLAQKQRSELLAVDPVKLNKGELLEYIVGFGSLAPSTHNTQPWKAKIKNDSIEVKANLDAQIKVADPTNRDLYISVGAFIKNILLACEALGIKTDLKIDLSGQKVAVINLKLTDKVQTKKLELLTAMANRQNFRGFFEKSLDKNTVNNVFKEVKKANPDVVSRVFDDKETIEKLARLTADGLKSAYAKEPFRREIAGYINSNISRKRTGLFGYSLRMDLLMSIIIPKILKKKDIGTKLAQLNYASFIVSPAVVTLSTKDDKESWVKTGLVLEEILIKLTEKGIFSSIYVAAIEIDNLRDSVKEITEDKGNTKPQLLFCIGQTNDPLPYTVRKDLEDILAS